MEEQFLLRQDLILILLMVNLYKIMQTQTQLYQQKKQALVYHLLLITAYSL